ncbi:MAG: histidine phosphatase family protein [Brachymonas sp.]
MSLQLWLIRHARVLAPEGICYGASDLAADPDGTLSAAQHAASLLPQGLPLYTSPLQRCSALARQLHKLRPDLKAPQSDNRLVEMNFGQWEGYPWKDIPKTAFDTWMANFGLHRFGGSESTQEIIARLRHFVQELQQTGIGQAAVICHAGSIRALHYCATQGARPIAHAREWPSMPVALGSCLQLSIDSLNIHDRYAQPSS